MWYYNIKFIILPLVDNSSIKTNSVEKTVTHELKFNNLLKKLKNILFGSDYKTKNFLILLKINELNSTLIIHRK